jgi:hypothetical protein
MGRRKLPAKLKRTVMAFKVSPVERALLMRTAEAMARELTLPASALGASAAIRMLVQREAARLGVQVPATTEGEESPAMTRKPIGNHDAKAALAESGEVMSAFKSADGALLASGEELLTLKQIAKRLGISKNDLLAIVAPVASVRYVASMDPYLYCAKDVAAAVAAHLERLGSQKTEEVSHG